MAIKVNRISRRCFDLRQLPFWVPASSLFAPRICLARTSPAFDWISISSHLNCIPFLPLHIQTASSFLFNCHVLMLWGRILLRHILLLWHAGMSVHLISAFFIFHLNGATSL